MVLHHMCSQSNLFWMHWTSYACVDEMCMDDKPLHLGHADVSSFCIRPLLSSKNREELTNFLKSLKELLFQSILMNEMSDSVFQLE